METITIETQAFYKLIEEVVARMKKESDAIQRNKWITSNETMSMLGVKTETTLKRLRDAGEIRFSQPDKRIRLYDRDSIETFIENHANKTPQD